MKIIRRLAVLVVVALVLIQFKTITKTNPPISQDIPTPENVKVILRKACYDCHSNETIWPWYSNLAPISWLVAKDVREGRKELNFSEWSKYSDKKKSHKIEEIWEEVEDGEMPPWFYVIAHPEASLSVSDKETLRAWVKASKGRGASN